MTPPRFTVVLSAYNEERLVGEAIGSVLAQTLSDFELIVVDDGSADGTAEVVRSFLTDSRVRLIKQENRGLAPSLNRAARAGDAPRIALIDADDLWFPAFLEEMDTALEKTPGAGFAYTDAWWYREATERFFRESISEYIGVPREVPADPEGMLLSLLRGNWVFGLTAMERDAFNAVGGFNESLSACEDYELWLRLLASGYPAARAPGRLAIQREREGSMSRNFAVMLENLKSVYRIVVDDLDVSDAVRDVARRRMEKMDEYIAAEESGSGSLYLWWQFRKLLGQTWKRVLPAATWHRRVPPEIDRAFPQGFSGRDLRRP
jgi:glycosyltransferase involved in cell wall biosynthesis